MSMLADYREFDGLAWATGYPRNLLAYQGITAPHTGKPYTEALLMGINGGICAGYFAFEYQGWDPHLHFLTLYPFDEEPGALFERLGIPMNVQSTTDPQKAVANILNGLAKGNPVIVWADAASFPFNNMPPSEDMRLVMPLVVYGYDLNANTVHIADRACVPLTATHDEMVVARARLKKTRNRIMTIGAPNADKLPSAVLEGIQSCINLYHSEGAPGMPQNFGFSGLRKWADLLTNPKDKKGWAKMFATGPKMFAGLISSYRYTEVWWTGGSGARGIYADFLDEAAVILNKPGLKDAAKQFRVSAGLWQTLTTALLPDSVEPFKQSRELMQRDYQLFLSQGNASLAERQSIWKQYENIKQAVEADFPLTEAQAAVMRAELRDHVMSIHDAEQIAVQLLTEAIQ